MRREMAVLMVAGLTVVSYPGAAWACGDDGQAVQAWWPGTVEPRAVTVTELAAWKKERRATAVDANAPQTRAEQGVIPGAVLLTSSAAFAVTELPADKATRLVFYCANQKCTASHAAARRAMDLGYTDVAVLPDGVAGWKQAGQPTSKPRS